MSSTTSSDLGVGLRPSTTPFTRTTVVRAGAGAGKTTELIRRVIEFIVEVQTKQDRDPHVCLTTFTRKATQEIRERLLEKALELDNERLLRYVQHSKSLQISTIHGSLRRYLSQYGALTGLAPDFAMMDATDESRLIKRCLRRLLRSHPQVPSAFQTIAEEWDLSGFIVAYRSYVENQVRFPHAKAVSKDEILAGHQQKLKLLDEKASALYHGLNGKTLSKGWIELQSLLSSTLAKSQRTLGDWIEFRLSRPTVVKSKAVEDILGAKEIFFEELDSLVDKDKIPEFRWTAEFADRSAVVTAAFQTVASELHRLVSQEKRRRGQLSMNDLELMSLELCQSFPATAEKFSQQWDFWLVDEYQDTSPLQVEILRRLVGSSREFVVGDPQQSIYLFRGARAEVFRDKEETCRRKNGEILLLNKNYRSLPNLMSLLNQFLPDMSSQLAPMEIGRTDDQSWPHPAGLFWAVPFAAENEDGTKKTRDQYRQTMEEAAIDRLHELISLGVAPETICVLARRNSDLEKLALRAQSVGLPVHLNASSQFANRREVRDAVAWLRFLVNPHDNVNLVELLRSPWFAAEDSFLVRLGQGGSNSYWLRWNSDFISDHVELRQTLATALDQCETQGLSQVWQKLLLERGLIDWSHRVDPSGRREGNLWKLITDLRWAERQAGFSYAQFIRDLDQPSADEEQIDAEAPAVIELKKINLMTIHASKGLQFDHILMADVGADFDIKIRQRPFVASEDDGTWSVALRDPEKGTLASSAWTLEQLESFKEREFEESDRLLYVALTRAKKSISLHWSEIRKNSWAIRFVPRLLKYLDWAKVRDRVPELVENVLAESTAGTVRKPWSKQNNAVIASLKPQDRPLDLPGLEKIQRGIETHRLLESLKINWEVEGSGPSEWRERLAQEPDVDVRHLIETGFVEWSFIAKLPPEIGPAALNGRIDLWGFDQSGQPWIVDYKTGDPKYADKAFQQLELYAWALYTLAMVPADQEIRLLPIFFANGPIPFREARPFTTLKESLNEFFTR